MSAPPSARADSPIATLDLTAVGKAQQNFGHAFANFAMAAGEPDQATKYDTESRFQEFKWQESQNYDEATKNAQPGAENFATQWAGGYDERAREFFKTVPESLKPRYDFELLHTKYGLHDKANKFEYQQKRGVSLADFENKAAQYDTRVASGEEMDSVKTDYQKLLADNPHFTPIEKQQMQREGYARIEKSHLMGRVQRGESFDSIYQDLTGTRYEKPLDTDENPEAQAKPISGSGAQRAPVKFKGAVNDAITNASKETGGDPNLPATGAQIESGGGVALKGPSAPSTGYLGPYGNMSHEDRQKTLREVQVGMRNSTFQELKDGAAAITRDGQAPVDSQGRTALDRAEMVLTPNQLQQYSRDWAKAKINHDAVAGMELMPEQALSEHVYRLATVKPTDPYYELHLAALNKASKRAEEIRKLRDRDPAFSVATAPEVQVAEQGARENPGDPEYLKLRTEARIKAQADIGIPDGTRSPITRSEARVLLAPTRGLEGEALIGSLNDIRQQLEGDYGPYARSAMRHAVEYVVRNKETSTLIEGVLNKAFHGLPATASDAMRLGIAEENSAAMQAFQSTPGAFGEPVSQDNVPAYLQKHVPPTAQVRPMPPERAVQLLMTNPELAKDFNDKYGPGMAEYILSLRGN